MSLSIAELNRLAADTGCEFHDDCLTCPFERCIYDSRRPSGRKAEADARKKDIKELRLELTVKELSEAFGVTRRTIYKALKGK